jgi:cysteine-rich repeat protein
MASYLQKVLLAAAALVAAACGGDAPFCGDGNLDPGEECDDGNDDDTDFCLSTCKVRPRSSLTVKWEFNRDAAPGFTGDSCIDLGARTVEVTLTGGPEVLVETESCSFRQAVFFDLPAANYEIELQVLNSEDSPLTSGPVTAPYEFSGGVASTEVVVGPEAWLGPYLGTFYFRIFWGGADCAVATPAVLQQRLTLVAGGETFTGMTTDGARMNGTAPSTCMSLEEPFPQSALDVPFGPATFTVQGLDDSGVAVFESEFETFVGAGVNNPELVFDVDLL